MKAPAYIELEDYLALENASRYKHEYLDGVIYAVQGAALQAGIVQDTPIRGMVGGGAAHADLIRNLGFALHTRLRGTPCAVKMTEMRLRIEQAGAVFYPDVLVHCTQPGDPAGTLELGEARLVAEVLSPSTERFDRSDKLDAYRRLVGLQHIVLLSSTEQAAWACHRDSADGPWGALDPWPRGAALALPSLGLAIGWDEVYGGVGLA